MPPRCSGQPWVCSCCSAAVLPAGFLWGWEWGCHGTGLVRPGAAPLCGHEDLLLPHAQTPSTALSRPKVPDPRASVNWVESDRSAGHRAERAWSSCESCPHQFTPCSLAIRAEPFWHHHLASGEKQPPQGCSRVPSLRTIKFVVGWLLASLFQAAFPT